jgi:hypothetical protein
VAPLARNAKAVIEVMDSFMAETIVSVVLFLVMMEIRMGEE